MNKKSTQRELVNRKRFNTSADKDLLETLDTLSDDTLIPKSKLIDRALELLFDEYEIDHRLPKNETNEDVTSTKKTTVISFKRTKKD